MYMIPIFTTKSCKMVWEWEREKKGQTKRRDNMKKNLRKVQWRPFQPCEQTHVPFLHCPCSAHRASHGNWSQRLPTNPALQRHLPFSQMPFGPQSKLQTATNGGEKWREKKKKENQIHAINNLFRFILVVQFLSCLTVVHIPSSDEFIMVSNN